jgi:hypothetical protein
MNTKKNKILIIALIAITLIAVIYIVYMFLGKKPTQTGESTGGTFSSFSSLLSRKKTIPGGSQINPNGTPVDVGGSDTDIPGTKIDPLNPGNPGNPGGVDPNNPNNPGGVNPNDPGNPGGVDINQGGFTPLPDPYNPGGGGIINPNDPNETPEDITKIDPVPDNKKKKPCDKTNLPKGVADIICDQGGLLPNGEVNIVNFSLNDEEQAELDRLSRMFARLAPYLKTESDIAAEKSNMEAYTNFNTESGRLIHQTNIERLATNYKGPTEIKSPFLNNIEFGSKIADDLKTELFGTGNLGLNPLNLLGIGRIGKDNDDDCGWNELACKISNKLFGTLDKDGFFNGLKDEVLNKLVVSIDSFVRRQAEQTLGTANNIKDDLPCNGKFETCVGSRIFEKTLDIY